MVPCVLCSYQQFDLWRENPGISDPDTGFGCSSLLRVRLDFPGYRGADGSPVLVSSAQKKITPGPGNDLLSPSLLIHDRDMVTWRTKREDRSHDDRFKGKTPGDFHRAHTVPGGIIEKRNLIFPGGPGPVTMSRSSAPHPSGICGVYGITNTDCRDPPGDYTIESSKKKRSD